MMTSVKTRRRKVQISLYSRLKLMVLGVVLMTCWASLYAQLEDDVSCLPPPKKVLQLIEKSKQASDSKVAVDGFIKALERVPENATIYFEYGLYAFEKSAEYYRRNPTMGDRSLKKSEELFLSCIDYCPDFHADAYYYLGVINYTLENLEASKSWFEKFMHFQSDNPDRYSADHTKKIADAKELLHEWQKENEKTVTSVPYQPEIVRHVSSPNDEYFPMISPDNELMFYTRRVNEKAKGELTSFWVEKFTVSQRKNMTMPFDNGTFLGYPFNDGRFDNYGASTLSVDNKEMILCACKTETVRGQPYKNCDLYSTIYERSGMGGNDFQWSELQNLGPAINTQDGWEGQPSLSADGNTLYFATTRKGSITLFDRKMESG